MMIPFDSFLLMQYVFGILLLANKDYLVSKRNGYTCCAANYMKGFIAAAEYGLNPEIHIYKYPGNQLVAKFKADTTIS